VSANILNGASGNSHHKRSENYKWIALSNTTLAVLLATLDASITLIAMPDIFRGIKLDPLVPGNSFYLLWMVLGYLVVSSVLIVSLGRLGDMYGRVRLYNLGFVVYTAASLLLTIDWMTGRAGATYLIVFRIVQGIGGAFLLANSAAILTDAFPANQRGMALGINNIVGVSGMFVGLILGGVLAPISWRLVFLISVPVGLFGTVWAYLKLQELSTPRRTRVDWPGNVSFALGLILIMVAITYGIRPYGSHPTGWSSPRVIILLSAGLLSLVAFVFIERRARDPMFRLALLRIRAFTFGTLSTFLAAVARGGLMFMLIIWLQGIWLPQHGYDFTQTPLWAGIYMLPLTVGMLISGPTSGYLSDRYGARPFATGGMIGAALSFGLLMLLPTDFSYPVFAAVLFMNGISMGLFASPNRAAVMNSLPPGDRGAGGGMNQTFQNSAQVLSVGIFFSLMILGLSSTLPHAMASGLQAHGVSAADATRISQTPPVSVLFAAFLGYNPIQHLAGAHVLSTLSAHSQAVITGQSFFPQLVSGPFRSGLHEAFVFAIIACLVAAVASLMRGGMYHHDGASPVTYTEEEQHADPVVRTVGVRAVGGEQASVFIDPAVGCADALPHPEDRVPRARRRVSGYLRRGPSPVPAGL
jgi:MFS family permease